MRNLKYVAALASFSLAPAALALDFDLGEVYIRLDNTVSAGAAWRVEDQDPNIIGRANTTADGQPGLAYSTNGDDGNLAFDKGDLISGGLKLNSLLSLNWGDYGAQVRGSYVHDFVLYDHDFFDPADYAGATGTPPRGRDASDLQRRRARLQDRTGNDAALLDGYVYANLYLGERAVSIRLGHQVLNWGESTLVLNGINSIVAADAAKIRVPGFDLSEVFIPAGMAWLSTDLADNLSMEVFYQYDWVNTEPDPSGSFFGSNDFATYGGETAEVGFGACPELSAPGSCAAAAGGSYIPRQPTRKPEQGGQGGVALHSFMDWMGGIDLGLYFANYHSRLPVISGIAAPAGFEGVAPTGGYFVEYPEDIKLYGISFNTSLPGGFALQGEYSLKEGQPLQLEDIEVLLAGLRTPLPSQLGPFAPNEEIQGWRRHDVSQWDVSTTKILGPIGWLGSDQALMLLEVAGSLIHGMPDQSELLYEGPGTYKPANPVVAAATGLGAANTQQGGYATPYSWGYRLAGRLSYNNVFDFFTIEPGFIFGHDVRGTSATPILNFVEGRKELRFAINTSFQQVWSVQLAYARYWGAGAFNLTNDRDNVGLAVSYSF